MIARAGHQDVGSLYDGMIVDLFAGGGGASMGIEMALGVAADVAVNHDPEAVLMHRVNHPATHHLCENVLDVDPRTVTGGRRVRLLWLSPDCTHHSKARGCKPVKKEIRGLAWRGIVWARDVKPEVIILENVEEFADWGPVVPKRDSAGRIVRGVDGRPLLVPCPRRKGRTFKGWVTRLRRLGYEVEWREMRACDYGAPTIRKRLFVVARCDGNPIRWPEQTHFKPPAPRGARSWRTAAECIDFDRPSASIFLSPDEARAWGKEHHRAAPKRPLEANTLRRVARGVVKHIITKPDPFIVACNHGGDHFRGQSLDDPLSTITASRDARGLVSACVSRIGQTGGNGRYSNDAADPLTTITSKAEHLLVSTTLIQSGYGERAGQAPRAPGLDKPLGTVVAGASKHAVVAAMLTKHYGGVIGHDLRQPAGTITSVDHHALTAAALTHFYSSNTAGGEGDPLKPLKTITAEGRHAGVVAAMLVKFYGNERTGVSALAPMHTVTSKDRIGLVQAGMERAQLDRLPAGFWRVWGFLLEHYGPDAPPPIVNVKGEPHLIVDITMRMLVARELYRGQGFPDSYMINPMVLRRRGRREVWVELPESAQIRMCGNSVSPIHAAAIIRANFRDANVAAA